jgi:phytanoyl-CoA hydroxylase
VQILGSVDRCDAALIEGWITVVGDADIKLGLEFVLRGEIIGRCVADQYRQDLYDANIGDGVCAFSFATPAFVPASELQHITVRLENSNVILARNDTQSGDTSAEIVTETASRFGGLWIDRYDWLDRLAAKHRKGEISDQLSVAIFRFVRDGYLILKEAVPAPIIDRLNAEIERMWVNPPGGLLVETFEPDGIVHCTPPDASIRAGRTKMLDLYAFSRIAREAIASPRTVEFLSAVFEGQPKAFQGLTFWNGSQQAIHKDTAYVKIDSNPMHLVATWLALEDVQPGTGELEYYVGSHRAPDFLFGGSSKWMESHTSEHERFLQSLHDDAARLGHVKGSFLANKGDVLVWHADLAHGGSPVGQPSRTRKSLVTHYTPVSDDPFYRRSSDYREADFGGCRFVSQYADVGTRV